MVSQPSSFTYLVEPDKRLDPPGTRHDGYPPNFGAGTLPCPQGTAILATGYPGTRIYAGYRVPGNILMFIFLVQWRED